MEFSIPGFIKEFCTPNALMTLEEYLIDYGTPETKAIGEKLIAEELAKLPEGDIKQTVLSRLQEIREGKNRDQYF
jgi:2-iminoacetate synthase